jgi:superoxide dismutase
MKLYEQYLFDHSNINEAAPATIGTAIAAVMGLSALTNVYIGYKERVREYGRNLNECKEKCELRYNLDHYKQHSLYYTDEDIKKLMQNKQDCIDKCIARYYKNVTDNKEKQKKIKDKIKDKLKEIKEKKAQFSKKGK